MSEASDQEREMIKKERLVQQQRDKDLDVTKAPRTGDAKDTSQGAQEQITKAPRDGAEKKDSTSGTA